MELPYSIISLLFLFTLILHSSADTISKRNFHSHNSHSESHSSSVTTSQSAPLISQPISVVHSATPVISQPIIVEHVEHVHHVEPIAPPPIVTNFVAEPFVRPDGPLPTLPDRFGFDAVPEGGVLSGGIAPNCGCVTRGACVGQVAAYTALVSVFSDVVCGLRFHKCCYDGPYPGSYDAFADAAPCVPAELCRRPYGVLPTDVRDFGAIAPCLNAPAVVRCLNVDDVAFLEFQTALAAIEAANAHLHHDDIIVSTPVVGVSEPIHVVAPILPSVSTSSVHSTLSDTHEHIDTFNEIQPNIHTVEHVVTPIIHTPPPPPPGNTQINIHAPPPAPAPNGPQIYIYNLPGFPQRERNGNGCVNCGPVPLVAQPSGGPITAGAAAGVEAQAQASSGAIIPQEEAVEQGIGLGEEEVDEVPAKIEITPPLHPPTPPITPVRLTTLQWANGIPPSIYPGFYNGFSFRKRLHFGYRKYIG